MILATKLLKLLETRHGPMLALPQDRYLTACLETYGEFSPDEWKLLAQIVKPGMVVVEAGANIGAHTVTLARACRPAPLYAFEPQRRVFQILCANLALNDVDNVVALPEACGATDGWASIPALDYAQPNNFGGVTLADAEAPGERVRVVTIDSLDLPSCGLIKVDVEGFELEAIAGAAETIRRHRPVLYVENDRREHQRSLIAMVHALGYRMYWHTPALVRTDNFRGATEDIFGRTIVSINMLCLPQERSTKTDLEAIDPADPRAPARLDPQRGPLGS